MFVFKELIIAQQGKQTKKEEIDKTMNGVKRLKKLFSRFLLK